MFSRIADNTLVLLIVALIGYGIWRAAIYPRVSKQDAPAATRQAHAAKANRPKGKAAKKQAGGSALQSAAPKKAPKPRETFSIKVNDRVVYQGDALVRDDLLFPLSFAPRAGVQAYFDKQSGIAVLHRESENVAVKADAPQMLVFLSNGDRWLKEGCDSALGASFDPLLVPMESVPVVKEGELFLPLRTIAAALLADPEQDMKWSKAERTVSITTATPLDKNAEAPQPFTAPDFLKTAFAGNRQS